GRRLSGRGRRLRCCCGLGPGLALAAGGRSLGSLDDHAGEGVDVVLVVHPVFREVHRVVEDAVPAVQAGGGELRPVGGYPGVGEGRLLGGVDADVVGGGCGLAAAAGGQRQGRQGDGGGHGDG